jgi:glycosyltransferase involved in cell wall biosynthesis
VRDAFAEGPPEISIIVSTKDRLSALRDCVESLRRDPCRKQVIIQDGASTDGTVEYLKTVQDVDWRSERDGSHVEGIRRALERVEGRFVLILGDDDTLIPGKLCKFLDAVHKF